MDLKPNARAVPPPWRIPWRPPRSSRTGYHLPAFEGRKKWVHLLLCRFFIAAFYIMLPICGAYQDLRALLVFKKAWSMSILLIFVYLAHNTAPGIKLASSSHLLNEWTLIWDIKLVIWRELSPCSLNTYLYLLLTPFYRWTCGGREKLSHLPNVIKLGGSARMEK